MASELDICKLALSRIGDAAVLTSIDPPDGTKQADRCAQLYPIARDSLLEMHEWGFITVRGSLAPVAAPTFGWAFAYAEPNNLLKILSVLPPNAQDDYSTQLPPSPPGDIMVGQSVSSYIQQGLYTPQAFAREQDGAGNGIILTNQDSAVARWTVKVTDTSKFPPLFVDCLASLLASYLAGPTYKGDVGFKMSQTIYGAFEKMFMKATNSDANNTFLKVQQAPTFIVNR